MVRKRLWTFSRFRETRSSGRQSRGPAAARSSVSLRGEADGGGGVPPSRGWGRRCVEDEP